MRNRYLLMGCTLLFITFVFMPMALASAKSDRAKEKRWADQIVDSIMTGEAVWLDADSHKILGIYTENEADKSLGGAIVLHGIGVHPNWMEVVHPLRTRLPELGWHTLSLQLPILPNDADYKDYRPLFVEIAPRINSGIDYLKQKGIKNVVIIGHSMGATMAAYFMATNDRAEVQALVAIGSAGRLFKDPERDFVHSIPKIKKPIMDLSGSEDTPEVLQTKQIKAEAAKKAGHKDYQQVEIQNANHFLVGKEDEMVEEISRWIKRFGE